MAATPLNRRLNSLMSSTEIDPLRRERFDIEQLVLDMYSHVGNARGSMLAFAYHEEDPLTQYFLEKRWRVTGVIDGSTAASAEAKPSPFFTALYEKPLDVDFDIHRFDAISFTNGFKHCSLSDQNHLLTKAYRWLNTQGILLFNYGIEQLTGEEVFEGVVTVDGEKRFYAHKMPGQLFIDIRRVGFRLESASYHAIGNEPLLWGVLRKP